MAACPSTANEWPQLWRDSADALAEIVAPGAAEPTFYDAESVLLEEIASAATPVTIVVLGPLTNIAAVLRTDPSLADNIEKIIVMGGAVSVAGNVEPELSAEWNLYAHPAAAQAVIEFRGAGRARSVGCDRPRAADRRVHRRRRLDRQRPGRGRSRRTRLPPGLDGMFMWDELAAVLTVQPEVATWSERSIVVEDDGSTVESPDGTPVQVAVGADAASVRSLVLGALQRVRRLIPPTIRAATFERGVSCPERLRRPAPRRAGRRGPAWPPV